jgi:hypothetical protein
MSLYTLKDVNQAEQFTTDKGTFQSWAVLIDHEGQEIVAQLNTKEHGKPPEVGEEVDADLSSNTHGWKLKKVWKDSAPSGGASTGQRPYDPAKDRRITHMANLKVAVSFWQIKAYLKEMDGPLAIQDVINIANILDEDVQAIK